MLIEQPSNVHTNGEPKMTKCANAAKVTV